MCLCGWRFQKFRTTIAGFGARRDFRVIGPHHYWLVKVGKRASRISESEVLEYPEAARDAPVNQSFPPLPPGCTWDMGQLGIWWGGDFKHPISFPSCTCKGTGKVLQKSKIIIEYMNFIRIPFIHLTFISVYYAGYYSKLFWMTTSGRYDCTSGKATNIT